MDDLYTEVAFDETYDSIFSIRVFILECPSNPGLYHLTGLIWGRGVPLAESRFKGGEPPGHLPLDEAREQAHRVANEMMEYVMDNRLQLAMLIHVNAQGLADLLKEAIEQHEQGLPGHRPADPTLN